MGVLLARTSGWTVPLIVVLVALGLQVVAGVRGAAPGSVGVHALGGAGTT
jgi:hypothetical protein